MTATAFRELIKANRELLYPVVPFDPATDRLLALDFTETNTELTDQLLNNISAFNDYIQSKLQASHARYGIGGYAEHRTVYRFSRVFDPKIPGSEPRRLHLGTDIWGKPHTPVLSPLDGIVHSFANNDQKGDYGATIILTHQLQGNTFYTLYGHLSLNSLKNQREGKRIEAGEIFAEFGIPAENGGWPPHLHFQLILDAGRSKGDYPGVCPFSEKDQWLANSPDPDLVLQLNRYLKTDRA